MGVIALLVPNGRPTGVETAVGGTRTVFDDVGFKAVFGASTPVGVLKPGDEIGWTTGANPGMLTLNVGAPVIGVLPENAPAKLPLKMLLLKVVPLTSGFCVALNGAVPNDVGVRALGLVVMKPLLVVPGWMRVEPKTLFAV